MADVIKRGEIYWIASGEEVVCGNEQFSRRPGIVVSNDTGNRYSPIVEIVYLSAADKKDLPTHATIRSALRPSTALCEQITTVSKERLAERVGACTPEEMAAVDCCMAISLGLDMGAPRAIPNPEPDTSKPDMSFVDDLTGELTRLERELTKAKRGEEIYKEMYTELLSKVLPSMALPV